VIVSAFLPHASATVLYHRQVHRRDPCASLARPCSCPTHSVMNSLLNLIARVSVDTETGAGIRNSGGDASPNVRGWDRKFAVVSLLAGKLRTRHANLTVCCTRDAMREQNGHFVAIWRNPSAQRDEAEVRKARSFARNSGAKNRPELNLRKSGARKKNRTSVTRFGGEHHPNLAVPCTRDAMREQNDLFALISRSMSAQPEAATLRKARSFSRNCGANRRLELETRNGGAGAGIEFFD